MVLLPPSVCRPLDKNSTALAIQTRETEEVDRSTVVRVDYFRADIPMLLDPPAALVVENVARDVAVAVAVDVAAVAGSCVVAAEEAGVAVVGE